MTRIVNIHPQGKMKLIILQDGRSILLPPVICMKYQLSQNMELTEPLLTNIIMESEKEKAFQYAYFLLSRRDYSQQNLAKKLSGKSFDKEVVEEVISSLNKNGYLDDDRLMKSSFMYCIRERKMGRFYTGVKLMEKGFSRESVDNLFAVEDEKDSEWEIKNCQYWGKKWISKKGFKSLQDLDQSFRQSLYQYLTNKGFSSYIVAEYIQEKD